MSATPASPTSPSSWAKWLWLAFAVAAVLVTTVHMILIRKSYAVASASEPQDAHMLIFVLLLVITFLLLVSAIIFSIIEALEKSDLVRAILQSFLEVLARLLTLDNVKQALKVVASAAPSLFILSVIYEAKYFQALNVSTVAIPISLVDRFHIFVIWIPHIIAVLITAYFILPTIWLTVEEALLSRSVAEYSRTSSKIKISLFSTTSLAIYGWLYVWISDISSMEFHSHIEEIYGKIIIFFCFFTVVAVYTNYRMFSVRDVSQRAETWDSPNRNRRAIQVVWAHTMWFIFLLFFQWIIVPLHAANSAKCIERNMYTFSFVNGESKEASLVRSFRNYFLIRDCESMYLEFLNSDEVRSIVKHRQEPPANQ